MLASVSSSSLPIVFLIMLVALALLVALAAWRAGADKPERDGAEHRWTNLKSTPTRQFR